MGILTSLPNIGKTLAEKLVKSGISSEQALKDLGSEKAIIKIATIAQSGVCINMLYALEGAIQGIRWHELSPIRKEELRQFFNLLDKQKFNTQKMNTTKQNIPMLGLRTAIYKVGNLSKAIEWYSRAFKTEPYFNEPYYVGFNIGGFELGLQQEENPTTEKPESVLTYWGVEDINKEFDRLIALGASEHEKPTGVGGELKIASLKDPWGNIIGLIYNPEFKIGF